MATFRHQVEIEMALEESDVTQIAHLARLAIDEADIPAYAGSLSSILELAEQLNSADTADITPMAHPLHMVQRLREDEVTESNQREHLQEHVLDRDVGALRGGGSPYRAFEHPGRRRSQSSHQNLRINTHLRLSPRCSMGASVFGAKCRAPRALRSSLVHRPRRPFLVTPRVAEPNRLPLSDRAEASVLAEPARSLR